MLQLAARNTSKTVWQLAAVAMETKPEIDITSVYDCNTDHKTPA